MSNTKVFFCCRVAFAGKFSSTVSKNARLGLIHEEPIIKEDILKMSEFIADVRIA